MRRLLAPCCQNQDYLRLLLCLRLSFFAIKIVFCYWDCFCNWDCFVPAIGSMWSPWRGESAVSSCLPISELSDATPWVHHLIQAFLLSYFRVFRISKRFFAIFWDLVGIESNCGVSVILNISNNSLIVVAAVSSYNNRNITNNIKNSKFVNNCVGTS